MARPVKCCVTGEYGDKKIFFKAGKKYYKTEALYKEERRKKQARHDLIDYVCKTFLGYEDGQPFSTFLPRKLQELKFYDDELILQVFQEQAQIIKQRFDVMQFENELGKISYMVGIVRNALPEAKQRVRRKEKQDLQMNCNEAAEIIESTAVIAGTRTAKDLSRWLEEEDL